ncbi:hypothetical protein ROW55_012480 [Providencia rettgeri]|uniref:hypothetical protein n=1 Tax=Providencia huaxiensis TaxID=2027290 RepID=UPI001B3586AF|nr:hypothetical protein [Providencia huaxiensis]MBQ0536314.1 hypothetical protein [Providencia huaxiensis]MBQ0590227.1 hypothetical protein [Providencia huaxiensis]MDW7802039.1 hypothetical protein [Providencia rettgeri]
MIELAGFSIFPNTIYNNELWKKCKKDIQKNFPVYFHCIYNKNFTIELCTNKPIVHELENKKTFFLGANTEEQTFTTDDHGVQLALLDGEIKIENDWLGSIPIFYDKENQITSTFYNAVALHNISEINYCNELGRNAFYKYGYSVFGVTPIKNVHFLKALSEIIYKDGHININSKKDTISITETTVDDVVGSIHDNLKLKISNDNDLIIPLSGGLDSRMLAGLIKEKKPLTVTYGGNKNNFEPIYAKVVAKKLDLNWNYIQLEDYYNLIDAWCSVYGLSTHAHGMYQIEFYRKLSKLSKRKSIISGIFADIWAGNSRIEISNKEDLVKLGYSHGLALSSEMGIDFSNVNQIEKSTFEELSQSKLLDLDSLHRIRLKIILIGYLMSTPRLLGYNVITPFLNKKVALSMLGLPHDLRKSRKWQFDLINQMDLNIPKTVSMMHASFINGMDASAMLRYNFNEKITDIKRFNNKNTGISDNNIKKLDKVNKLTYLEKFNLFASSTRGVQRIITKAGLRSKALIYLRDIQCIYPFIYIEKLKSK